MSTEQWKEEGDCTKCRRFRYCGTTCKAAKKRDDRIIKQAFYEVLAEKLSKESNNETHD